MLYFPKVLFDLREDHPVLGFHAHSTFWRITQYFSSSSKPSGESPIFVLITYFGVILFDFFVTPQLETVYAVLPYLSLLASHKLDLLLTFCDALPLSFVSFPQFISKFHRHKLFARFVATVFETLFYRILQQIFP